MKSERPGNRAPHYTFWYRSAPWNVATVSILPAAKDLHGSCGCSDHMPLCEHVMAALHGFGARLDAQPELLLLLRGVVVAAPSAPTSLRSSRGRTSCSSAHVLAASTRMRIAA